MKFTGMRYFSRLTLLLAGYFSANSSKNVRVIGASPGRKILANKIPVDRLSEAFDQESAGHNWLLTSRSKILKSEGSIEFLSIFAVSTEMHWITS